MLPIVFIIAHMKALKRFVISIAATLVAAFLGGCIGFLVARILAEGVGLVEGPPAGVLLVVSVLSFALLGGALGVIFALRWIRRPGTNTT